MLDAKRLGEDPILSTSRVPPVRLAQTKLGVSNCRGKFLSKTEAFKEWSRVVRTLRLEQEVGPTLWDTAARAFTRSEDIEGKGEKTVFEVRVEEADYFFNGLSLFVNTVVINECF